jgi:hypothetical protein
MKLPFLAAILLSSTITASESPAQDTIATTKTGVPVITAPQRTVNTAAGFTKAPPVKPETTAVHLPGRTTGVQADTAAIRRAADTGNVPVEGLRIVGDTAWVRFKTSRTVKADTVRPAPDLTVINENKTWDLWETRVERRGGKWVRVSTNARP